MRLIARPALAAGVAIMSAVALGACSSSGGTSPTSPTPTGATSPESTPAGPSPTDATSPTTGGDTSQYAKDATFTMVLAGDPGNLDPGMSAAQSALQLASFAYDPLINIAKDGSVVSGLATAWKVDGSTLTFTIGDNITCSDGSTFTAQTAADNINFISNPDNKSPLLGVMLPASAKATASGSTLTITLDKPSPFVLESIGGLYLVCDAGLKDRSKLAQATIGTGPFVLSEAVPDDHYTLDVNPKYTWGPDGASTSAPGTPAKVNMRIISDQSTAANLVLSGDVNAATITGPDQARLDAAGLFKVETEAIVGQQWYNEADGHPTSDPAVRKALTQALDLDQMRGVITGDTGVPGKRLAVLPPSVCNYDAVTGNQPTYDAAAAKAGLDAAGWTVGADGTRTKDGKKLSITFLYNADGGAPMASAAELATQFWQAVGIQVDAKAMSSNDLIGVVFGTGDFDVHWISANLATPDQAVAFVSGPAPADGGSNLGGIVNATYDEHVAKAMALTGSASCDEWKAAESALFADSDLVIFANSVAPTYGNKAQFDVLDHLPAMSVKMLAN